MTIADLIGAGKAASGRIPAHILVVLIIILCTTAAFGLGILAARELGPQKAESADNHLWIEQLATSTLSAGGPAAVATASKEATAPAPAAVTPSVATQMTYVASKNGTKYYLPSCSGANRIKEENKIWFRTKEEAVAHGLTPAANCPGL